MEAPTASPEPARAPAAWRIWLLLLGLGLSTLAYYGVYNPAYNNADELSHMQHVVYVRDYGAMPDPYAHARAWQKAGHSPARGSKDFKVQQDKHPPYLYWTGAFLLRLSETWFQDSKRPLRLPGWRERSWELGHEDPMLHVRDGQLLLLRAFCAAHWLLALVFLQLIGLLVFSDRPRYAFALTLFVGMLPQAAMSGAALTPDTPLCAFAFGAWYFLLRRIARPERPTRDAILCGLFFAFALASKSAAVHFVPVVLLCTVLLARRESWKRALVFLGITAAIPAVLIAWWYVRNFVLYGDFFQMRAQVETYAHSIRRTPLTPAFFETLIEDSFRTFFGFYHHDNLLPRPLYYVFAGILGVSLLGLVQLWTRRPLRDEVPRAALELLPLAALGLLVMLVLSVLGNLTVPSAQGRYLYPVLPCVLLLFGTGLRAALRQRGDRRSWYVWGILWLVLGICCFDYAALSRHAALRRHAQGDTRVLHYVDCGSQAPDPWRLEGTILPDPAMLGRSVPWRSLVASPGSVRYRLPMPGAADWERGLQLRLTYFSPDLSTPYVAEAKGRFVYSGQRLLVNGQVLHGEIEVTGRPATYIYDIPVSAREGEALELQIERVHGSYAVLSEFWLEQSWLQRQIVPAQGDHAPQLRQIINRSQRRLPFLRYRNRPEAPGIETLPGWLAPGESNSLPAEEETLPPRLAWLSPWAVFEAEAHPFGKQYWYGQLEASGAYYLPTPAAAIQLPQSARQIREPEPRPMHCALRELGQDGRWRLRTVRALTAKDGVLRPLPSTQGLDRVLIY